MWQKNVRYLDYNASSGISLFVKEKLFEFLRNEEIFFANPSSRHRLGQRVKHLLSEATNQVAKSLGANVRPHDLIFTSSGTESNQTVIRSIAKEVDGMIIGAGEHSASHDLLNVIPLSFLHELPLLRSGQYDLNRLQYLLSRAEESGLKKIGLSLFWANNETGVLNHLDDLKKIIDGSRISVLLHLDGAQAWGKIPLELDQTPAQFITFSSHKIGAPAGTGVIWLRNRATLSPLILGTQSSSLRGGTENVLGILATGAAASKLQPELFIQKTKVLQDALEKKLMSLKLPVKIWGQETSRVSNTTRFSFKGFKSYENWVELLDLKGFAVSHGSACKAQIIEPSRVLLKMGAESDEALNSVRVSFGPDHSLTDVDAFWVALQEILEKKNIKLSSAVEGSP